MTRPALLDLCCGAGGLSMGYHRAGFEVVGVDLHPQPRYPFTFHQADALEYLERISKSGEIERYTVVHSSWPCQRFARVTAWRGSRDDHDDLLTPGRELMDKSGRPWVIENVPEAPLRPDYLLCGSQFGLKVRRHRAFETSWGGGGDLLPPCWHHKGLLPVRAQRRARVCRRDGLQMDDQDRGPPSRTTCLRRVDRQAIPRPTPPFHPHHAMRRLLPCRDCRRPILWTTTEAGKRLAVDPDPNPTGNAAVWRDGTGAVRSRRPTAELPLTGWERLHMPHVATCPARTQQLALPGTLPAGVTSLDAHRRKKRR